MFGFFRRPASRPLSEPIQRAMQKDGLTQTTTDPSQLRMVESTGRYSDRKVNYFRVFLPDLAAQQSLDVRQFSDLDQSPGLILRSGHVEKDGTVVLTRPIIVRAADGPRRTNADRAMHTDDAHIVRGETGASPNVVASPVSTSERPA